MLEEYDHKQEEHREFTLNGVALLGIFLVIVVACGVFFGFGYSVGRHKGAAVTPPQIAVAPPVNTPAASQAGTSAASAPASPPNAAAPMPDKKPTADLPGPTTPAMTSVPVATQANATANPPASGADTAPTQPTHFVVQLSASSSKDDAKTLAAALGAKGYSASVRRAGDSYRVQIGPFASQEEAAGVRDKLVDEGYMGVVR